MGRSGKLPDDLTSRMRTVLIMRCVSPDLSPSRSSPRSWRPAAVRDRKEIRPPSRSSRPRTSGATSSGRSVGRTWRSRRSSATRPPTRTSTSRTRATPRLSPARLVIVNGLGYDDFVSKLLDATRNRGPRRAHGCRRAARDGDRREPAPLVRHPARPRSGARDRIGARRGRSGRQGGVREEPRRVRRVIRHRCCVRSPRSSRSIPARPSRTPSACRSTSSMPRA